MHVKHPKITLFGPAAIILGILGIMPSFLAHADSSVTTPVSISIPTSCTFTAGGGSYSTTISAGQTDTIVANNITTSCNDSNGYAIYAIGYSDDSYDGTYHTDLIHDSNNSYNIKTNPTSTDSSNWKMKLTAVSNAIISDGTSSTDSTEDFTNYHIIPSTFTKVASYTTNTTSSTITPTYQISIDNTQSAGTYTGKVKYVLVHPSTTVAGQYSIAYNPNGGTGTTEGHSNVYNSNEITLANNNFTAPYGFSGFKGWCTTNTSKTTCIDDTLYQPGDTAFSLGTAGSTVNLYAIWDAVTFDDVYAAANKSKTNDYYVMQDLEANMCKDVSEGQTSTLIDTRDNSTYTVAKLNGNCWMTQNLRITHSTGQPEGTILATGSNFSSKEKVELTNGTSFNSYATPQYHTPTETDLSQSGLAADQVGAWYNFCAASAKDTKNYGCNNSASYSGSEDICPAGWRLPTDTENGSLRIALNNNSTAKLAFNPVYGGGYNSSSPVNAASSGYWWSSTARSASLHYYLRYSGGRLNTNIIIKSNGFYIRCMRSGT